MVKDAASVNIHQCYSLEGCLSFVQFKTDTRSFGLRFAPLKDSIFLFPIYQIYQKCSVSGELVNGFKAELYLMHLLTILNLTNISIRFEFLCVDALNSIVSIIFIAGKLKI